MKKELEILRRAKIDLELLKGLKLKGHTDTIYQTKGYSSIKLALETLDKILNTPTNLGDVEEVKKAFNRIRRKLPHTLNIATEVVDILTIENYLEQSSNRIITADEIVKELNEHFYQDNKQYFEFLGNKRFVQNNTFNKGICVEKGILISDFNLPLETAHKITTFFTQQKDSE